MSVDTFARFARTQEEAFVTALRKEAKKIRLTDILRELTNEKLMNIGTVGSEGMENPSAVDRLEYRIGQYPLEVHVDEQELRVYGPHQVSLRKFSGSKVKSFYCKQKKELQEVYDAIELAF